MGVCIWWHVSNLTNVVWTMYRFWWHHCQFLSPCLSVCGVLFHGVTILSVNVTFLDSLMWHSDACNHTINCKWFTYVKYIITDERVLGYWWTDARLRVPLRPCFCELASWSDLNERFVNANLVFVAVILSTSLLAILRLMNQYWIWFIKYNLIMFSWISFLNLNQLITFGQHQNNIAW